jgi:HSP20 family protein
MLIRSVLPRVSTRRISAPRYGVDSILGEFWSRPELARPPRIEAFVPRVDISESAADMILRAELPGMGESDFEVTVEGDVLTIHGEKSAAAVEESRRRVRGETRSGSFTRSFQLPFEADADLVSASLRDGVLTVSVPKPEVAATRSIPITVA